MSLLDPWLIGRLFIQLLVLALILLPVIVLGHWVRQAVLRRRAWQVAEGTRPAELSEIECLLRVVGAAPSDPRDGDLLRRLTELRDHLSRP